MTKLITGLLIGLIFGFVAHAAAQFGNHATDERVKNWNERRYEQRLQNHQDFLRKPC